jgi:hypothetical protein
MAQAFSDAERLLREMIRMLALAAALVFAGAASAAAPGGRLSGTALISFGCPGPVMEGDPGCNPWRPVAHARVSIGGRTVVADARGRFALGLRAGTYVVAGLAQAHTRGAPRVVVRVSAGRESRVVLRFDGYPKMV